MMIINTKTQNIFQHRNRNNWKKHQPETQRVFTSKMAIYSCIKPET